MLQYLSINFTYLIGMLSSRHYCVMWINISTLGRLIFFFILIQMHQYPRLYSTSYNSPFSENNFSLAFLFFAQYIIIPARPSVHPIFNTISCSFDRVASLGVVSSGKLMEFLRQEEIAAKKTVFMKMRIIEAIINQ